MSVNIELLTKAAKVYDCSEPVEGMKPKMQYEEHKKMTPDEFSREHTSGETKAAEQSLSQAISQAVAPLAGASLGGMGGGLAGVIGGGLHGAYDPGAVGEIDEEGGVRLRRRSRLMGALRGAAAGGAGGLAAGTVLGGMAGKAYGDHTYGSEEPKIASAFAFGTTLAHSLRRK
jgi:hypothetical protein